MQVELFFSPFFSPNTRKYRNFAQNLSENILIEWEETSTVKQEKRNTNDYQDII